MDQSVPPGRVRGICIPPCSKSYAQRALAASLLAEGTSRLENKEGNRAESIREEYAKLGIEVDLDEEDTMKIRGGRIRGGHVHSHDDHRIAMSLAVAALNADTPVVIENPACVAKSFPDFFERLESLRTAE